MVPEHHCPGSQVKLDVFAQGPDPVCLQVTSYSLALREIDTVQDEVTGLPDGGYTPNVLEVVLRKRHLEMLSEPLLTTLLAHKWHAFARTQVGASLGTRPSYCCQEYCVSPAMHVSLHVVLVVFVLHSVLSLRVPDVQVWQGSS